MSDHGTFIWYDLMTTDVKAALAFYGNVVGWTGRDPGVPGVEYTVLNAGEVGVGGVMALPKEARDAGAKPGWNGYILCDDVDAMAETFAAEGGTIHKGPADIPTIGRFAMVSDPQGVVITLFKPFPREAPPPPASGTPGHVGWRELHAADGAKAFDFYARHFGWTKSASMPMGDLGVYQLFAYGGEDRGAVMTKMPQSPKPFWMFYVQVDGIDAAKTRVEQNGGKIINGPMEVPGGQWIVQCIDPQGALFALVAPGH
jgi:predicted enzyme related to lactoylglutathione lyase